MSLKSIKNLKRGEGFTLVELLIVIVVIGILAAITLVAYNGVQQKAHKAAGQAAASEVIKKAAIYATENSGAFPATSAGMTGASSSDPAYVSSSDVSFATPTASTSDNTVSYAVCGAAAASGAKVGYWDPTLSTPAIAYLTTGTGC